MELDAVPKTVYWDVVDHCYLCDMCYMTKCPVCAAARVERRFSAPDAACQRRRASGKTVRRTRDKILSATDTVGKLAGIPVVVNA